MKAGSNRKTLATILRLYRKMETQQKTDAGPNLLTSLLQWPPTTSMLLAWPQLMIDKPDHILDYHL